MNSALVSIIIPYYNSDTYFEDLLVSLREQTTKDLEIIVIDDKSSDISSSEKLKEILEKFEDLNIVYRYNEENLGVAGTRNVGFKLATGEFITYIDADDLLCGKYSLEHRVSFLKNHPEFSGIGGYDYRIDENSAIKLNLPDKKIEHFRRGVNNPDDLRQIYADNVLKNSLETASALFFATGSCLFRKEDIEDYPFDPEYESEDDIEWLLRFLEKKKIKLEMIPFHCRRIHSEQYHLRTLSETTQKVFDLAKKISESS